MRRHEVQINSYLVSIGFDMVLGDEGSSGQLHNIYDSSEVMDMIQYSLKTI